MGRERPINKKEKEDAMDVAQSKLAIQLVDSVDVRV